ncbi:hypothetical protein WME99_49065 [Sorangium sp. So ce136]|uniref:hypothetical protein n=1 Tax=Sorangium sp. So ce136 TaxID=3133284 RepID=UPI003EFFEBD0
MVEPPAARPATGPYPQLGAIAAWLGVAHAGAPEISAWVGGMRVVVSLQINSGIVCGMSIHVPRAGLLNMTLRPESSRDVRGKELGINREVQWGDADFDARVYVETDAPDVAVRALLESSRARAAVVALLRWCPQIVLSATGIHATTDKHPELFDPAHFSGVLAAIRELATVPAVHVDPAELRGRTGIVLVVLAVVATPVVLGAALAALGTFPPQRATLPFIGLASGLGLWALIRPLLALHVRGHSRAYRYYLALAVMTFIDLPALGCALAVGINGAADRSPEDKQVGVIATIRQVHNDDGNKTDTTTRWLDGSTSSHMFDDPAHQLRVGDPVVIVRRAGFFGFAWQQESAVAYWNSGGRVP